MPARFMNTALAAAVTAALGLATTPAWAGVDGLGFDMDGNIGNTDGGSGSNANNQDVDWESLVTGAVTNGYTTPDGRCTLINFSFLKEVGDLSVAHQGPTKDFNDFGDWNVIDNSASPKSDLIHMAHAAWLCDHDGDGGASTPEHLVFQFAVDRDSTNGTTFVGFWALQQALSIGTDSHVVNDILTVTDFQGSIAPGDTVNETLGVYSWAGLGAGAIPNPKNSIDVIIDPDANLGTGGCTDGGEGDIACTIVNEVQEAASFGPAGNSGWHFTSGDSGSPADMHTPGSLVEGTVDLSAATNNPNLCIATAVFETRQSSSIKAILDDLHFAQAPTCGLEVAVSCVGLGQPNYTTGLFDYTITGTVNTTAGTTNNVQIDRLLPGPVTLINGDVDNVNTTGVSWGNHNFSSSANPVTVQVKATDKDGLFTEATSTTLDCPARTPEGQIRIDKDCVACIVDNGTSLGITVRAAGEVAVSGSSEVPILSFDIVETAADTSGVPFKVASFPTDCGTAALTCPDPNANNRLDPGEKVSYKFEYNPESIPLLAGGTASSAAADDIGTFDDTAKLENVMAAFGFTVTGQMQEGAMCPICVPGTAPDPEFGLNCDPAL